MKAVKIFIIVIICEFIFTGFTFKAGQNREQEQIDSLINVLVKERRQWNEASELLIAMGEPAVDELMEVLLDKSIDSWSRRKAAMTLSNINSTQIIEPCLNVFLDTTENVSVRVNACNALSSVDLRDYEDLFLHWAKDDNQGIKNCSYSRLGQIGSDNAIRFLISEVDNQPDMSKWIILHILEPIQTKAVTRKFIEALSDENWWMLNEYAKNVLVKRGEEVINRLNEILNNHENSEFLRWKAIWIIKDIEDSGKFEILQKALNDESWFIRNEAEVALKKVIINSK